MGSAPTPKAKVLQTLSRTCCPKMRKGEKKFKMYKHRKGGNGDVLLRGGNRKDGGILVFSIGSAGRGGRRVVLGRVKAQPSR